MTDLEMLVLDLYKQDNIKPKSEEARTILAKLYAQRQGEVQDNKKN